MNVGNTKRREITLTMTEKRERNWNRVLEVFKTGHYLNEGAYGSIPTIRGNLEEKVL